MNALDMATQAHRDELLAALREVFAHADAAMTAHLATNGDSQGVFELAEKLGATQRFMPAMNAARAAIAKAEGR